MFERSKQLRIQPSETGQVLGVEPVVLAPLAIDELELTGVGDQDLVTPRSFSSRLIHGEWVPTSMAIRIGSQLEKRLSEGLSGWWRSAPLL